MTWNKSICIKKFLTTSENYEDIQESMNKIADVLEKNGFPYRLIGKMRNIPLGDDTFKPSDYANRYLSEMYDYADMERIWIN